MASPWDQSTTRSRKRQHKLSNPSDRRILGVKVIPREAEAYDVVVVGGGAAGLSAALVLGRARRRVAVIDAGGPRNAPAAHMQGFLSRDGMPPADFLAVGRAEVTGYGVDVIEDQVLGIEAGFFVRLAGGQVLRARRLLVATGVLDELPEIPGVRQRWGRDLLHCPTATAGRCATNPSGFWGPSPARYSMHNWCGSGPTTSSSSSIAAT